MRLFDFVQQDHAIRVATHLLGQLTTLVIANIAWRATKQAGDRMGLHVLRHIEADQFVLAAKEFSGQGLRHFRLTNTCRAKEQERTNGAFRILQTCTRAADSASNCANSLVLTNNPLAQIIFQVQQILALALDHLADGHPRPVLNNLRY